MAIVQQNILNPCSKSTSRTVSSTTTNLNLQTLFGSDFTDDSCKTLVIEQGVTVGSNTLMEAALSIPSGMGGTMKIINYGSILGAGGGAGQLKGLPNSECTIYIHGTANRILVGDGNCWRSNTKPTNYRTPGRAWLYDMDGNLINIIDPPNSYGGQSGNAYSDGSPEYKVAIGGNRMVIGMYGKYHSGTNYYPTEGFWIYDLNGNLQSGSSPIRHSNASANWCSSIAMNSSYIVVGDVGYTGYQMTKNPAVYVYNHSGTHIANWKGTDTASGGADGFGYSVDINEDNDIVVGAPWQTGGPGPIYAWGAAYYFPNFNTSGQVKVTSDVTTSMNLHFGRSVAIGKSKFLVGAPFTKTYKSAYNVWWTTGRLHFYNFSGTNLWSGVRYSHSNGVNEITSGKWGFGVASPKPTPSSDDYWLVSQGGGSYSTEQVAMYDNSYNRVGAFDGYTLYRSGGYLGHEGSLGLTSSNATYPRVVAGDVQTNIFGSQGHVTIWGHGDFRHHGSSGSYDQQIGITTTNYIRAFAPTHGEDGGDAIRCNSSDVSINNVGTIYGGGGGGGAGCRQYISDYAYAFRGPVGGRGQGYNQSSTNGSSISLSGQTVTSGNGGSYGNSGGAGAPGMGSNYNYAGLKNFDPSDNTHWGGKAGFISTTRNINGDGHSGTLPIFLANGTRGGRI